MKTNVLIGVICLIISTLTPPRIFAGSVEVNATNFPDAKFREYIQTKLNNDYEGDKSNPPYDAATNSVNTDVSMVIDCRGYDIKSLKGIEHFTNISKFQCGNNHLLSLGFNPAIDYVWILNFGSLDGADNTENAPQFRNFMSETVSLKELDPDFDPARVRNLTGAAWADQSNGVIKFDADVTLATYEYHCVSGDPNDTDKDKYYMKVRLTKGIPVDEAHFPDENFRTYIKEKLNGHNNSTTPYDTATNTVNPRSNNVTIDCRGLNINSLKGVEHFESIENISCANNHLLSLSVNPGIDYIRFTNIGILNDGYNPEQTRTVTTETVSLKELDTDFDPARVRNLTGGEWVNQSEGIIKINDGVATYEYRCVSGDPNDSEKNKYYMAVKIALLVPLDEAHFPDAHFRECLKTAINAEPDNKNAYDSGTNTIRVTDVQVINCNAKGIKNLKGIELFPNLGRFFCTDNNLVAFRLHPKAKVWADAFNGQHYDAGDSRTVDLAKVDAAFDPAKLTDLEGAELNGTTLSFGEHSFEATYIYHPIDGDPDKAMSVEISRYAEGMEINETNFPSESFRKFLNSDAMAKYRKDNKISLGINKLDIDWQHDYITHLDGIQHFAHLQILNINDRKVGESLATVDLPTSLVHLYCSNVEDLTKIKNLAELTNLESLNVANNGSLKELDVTYNTKLKKLSCGSDGAGGHTTVLEKLTLPSDPSSLEEIDCSRTKLKALDLTECTGLKFLKINFARDLSELKFPKSMDGENTNQVQTITCDNCNLKEIDLTNCGKLRKLECNNNILTGLDVSHCTVLDTLACGNPLAYPDSKFNNFHDAELDLSNNKTLKWLECMHLNITGLDLSKHTNLEYINCGLNRDTIPGSNPVQLKAFQLTLPESAPNLRTLNCGSNYLTDELDNIRVYPNLRILECADNQISHLDVSQNTQLTYLYARENKYDELDVTNNTELRHLTCSYNPLKTLDVSRNTKLTSLNCNNSDLEMLDVSNNLMLDTLHVELCHLIALDLTRQKNLFDIKLDHQTRDLGYGDHFNMQRRNKDYKGSGSIQDLRNAVFTDRFDGEVNTEDDDFFNFGEKPEDQSGSDENSGNTPSPASETTEPDLSLWLTFDEGKNSATYNYRTGGLFNSELTPDPNKSKSSATTARKAVQPRSNNVPDVYEDTGDGKQYALMDVTVTRLPLIVLGIEDVKEEPTAVSVRVEPGAAVIDGAEGRIAVYTTSGALAAVATAADGLSTRIALPSGFYLVVTSTSTEKILVP